jgi:hypothetical protein
MGVRCTRATGKGLTIIRRGPLFLHLLASLGGLLTVGVAALGRGYRFIRSRVNDQTKFFRTLFPFLSCFIFNHLFPPFRLAPALILPGSSAGLKLLSVFSCTSTITSCQDREKYFSGKCCD